MNEIFDFLGPDGFGSYEVDWSGPTFTRVSKPSKGLLVPGFVDLHIHGAFGADFMSASTDDLNAMIDRLVADGYEGLLLTTVTAPASEVLAAFSRAPERPEVLGFHLEGPFISRTYPGAQPPESINDVPCGASEWDAVFDHPKLKLVTMAPEIPRGLDLISRLSNRGVIVSMGHTNATFDEARFGYEFGARHTTHTYNAMRPLHHREAGTVGYAFANDGVACELIYDRLHVSRDAAGILLKSKPKDKVVAVSDSTLATGTPPNRSLTMWGHKVETSRQKVTLAGTETLAGSAITLLDAFRNLDADFGPEVAIRLCCHNPRSALGITGMPRVLIELNAQRDIVGLRTLR